MAVDPALIDAVRASAERLGINPSDLLTSMSYETGGTLSPSMYGGKGGQYLGLIQFSPENQKKYGVTDNQSAAEQMAAVESYLRDRGVKPGMGLLDVYSAINAGRPGLYNRSDAANGGAPGTVADKVATMAPHRMRANALLGLSSGSGEAAPAAGTTSVAPAAGLPATGTPAAAPQLATPDSTAPDSIAPALQQFAQIAQEEEQPLQPVSPVQINFPMTAAQRAKIARIAAAARGA